MLNVVRLIKYKSSLPPPASEDLPVGPAATEMLPIQR